MYNQNYRKILSKISGISIPILSKADSVLSKNNDKLIKTPLICIVGPPRVGSTILYQSVINKLDVDYFTNLEYMFYRYPNTIFYLNRILSKLKKYNSTGTSAIGFESGLFSPSEFSRFWEDFFNYSLNDPRRSENILPVSHAISALNKRWESIQKPLVTSWNPHVFYYEDIIRKFQNVLFVVMIREPIEIARSIYHGRILSNENLDEWWSYIPKSCTECTSSYQQIACQTASFLKKSSDLIEHNPSSIMISYDEFCDKPIKIINEIAEKFHSKTKIKVAENSNFKSLDIRKSKGKNIDDEHLMKNYLAAELSKIGFSYKEILRYEVQHR